MGKAPLSGHVWLTLGDIALEAEVDFLAVVEHRLIPARVRSERTVWLLPGLQPFRIPRMLVMLEVDVISMRGAPVALPSFATAQFRLFFDCGRAVRCMLPLGVGRFMHLFVFIWLPGC